MACVSRLYCPACSGTLASHVGLIVRVIVEPFNIELALDRFFACTGCALVTEVNQEGVLTDVDADLEVTISDLTAPVIPALREHDELPMMMQRPTLLHGRRDS